MSEADIRQAFLGQAEACRRLGSPFTARICALLGETLDHGSRFGDRILTWPGDAREDALALRAAGALHALARSRAPDLAAVYPPAPDPDEGALRSAVAAAIASHDDILTAFLDSPPQTNEIGRSSILLGGYGLIAETTDLPLEILEIGASAGLNLRFDRYRYRLGSFAWGDEASAVVIRSEWRGAPVAAIPSLVVHARAGCDLAPIDPADAEQRDRLLAYIWPDQGERMARTAAALDLAADMPVPIEMADAADWAGARLRGSQDRGVARVLSHTIVWQYLPNETRARLLETIRHAADRATADRPLAWLRMEADERKGSAAVRLALWPGSSDRLIARADFHGRWVAWS